MGRGLGVGDALFAGLGGVEVAVARGRGAGEGAGLP
jgi:hypothetical protein